MYKDGNKGNAPARPPPSPIRREIAKVQEGRPEEKAEAAKPAALRKDTVIPGSRKYTIKGELGKGGMGSVWEAEEEGTLRRVAIKIILEQMLTEENKDRFFEEARTLSSVRHPNIVRITDFGGWNNKPFIVMEYLDGESLIALIRRKGMFSWPETASITLQICDGLQAAHERGIIHRDMKPGNVFVLKDGSVKVIDFGLAKAPFKGIDQSKENEGLVGTVKYMSPEQIRQKKYDHRIDIYAVGLTMYYMLCGIPPYDSSKEGTGAAVELATQHLQAAPKPLRELRPDLSEAIERIVMRAMAKDPDLRFQDTNELKDAIMAAGGRLLPEKKAANNKAQISLAQPAENNEEEKKPVGIKRPSLLRSTILAAVIGAVGTVGALAAYHYREDVYRGFCDFFGIKCEEQAPKEKYEILIEATTDAIVYEELKQNGRKMEMEIGETPRQLRIDGDRTFIIRNKGREIKLSVTPAQKDKKFIVDLENGGIEVADAQADAGAQ